jgi:uncharacterized protein
MAISHQLLLTLFPGLYAIARFAPQGKFPFDYTRSKFFSLTKTSDELSIVCEQSELPPELPPDVRVERDRRVLRIESVLAFSMTGILSSIAVPLADAGISLFAVSSFDTDYFLISHLEIEPAITVLENAGHKVQRSFEK